jgi:hypothetical protein
VARLQAVFVQQHQQTADKTELVHAHEGVDKPALENVL